MTKRLGLFSVVIVLCGGFSLFSQTTTQPAPGVSTGEKIGNAVAAAVKTAFPAVQPVITAIFGDHSDPGTKKTKAQASDAVTAAHTAAVAKQQPQMDMIKQASSDLATVRTFLSFCVNADEQLVTMMTILDVQGAPDNAAADKLQYAWISASANLQKLGDQGTMSQIDAIHDPFVQTTLGRVANANLGSVQIISKQLDKKDWVSMRASLTALQEKVSGVNALTGILIGDISSGLAAVPDKIKSSMGATPIDPEATSQREQFVRRLETLYPAPTNH